MGLWLWLMGRRSTTAFAAAILVAVAGATSGCAGAVERASAKAAEHDEEGAARLLRSHLAREPDDREARQLLVRVLAAKGDLPGAREEVKTLVKQLGPSDPTPWIELGHALELVRRFDDALVAYDDARFAAPSSPAGPKEGGLRAAHWGLPKEAEERLAEAVKRGARDAETLHALGLARVHLGNFAGAREAYGQCSAPECILGLATVAVLEDDGARALAAYDALLVLRPGHAPAHQGRAWALSRLGRSAEAEGELTQALALGASRDSIAKQRAALRDAGPSETDAKK